MAYLELSDVDGLAGSGFFKSAAEGWGPFTFLTRKEDRKSIKTRAKAAMIESATAQSDAEFNAKLGAIEALRAKINKRMEQAEVEATLAGELVENIRAMSGDAALIGDPLLEKVMIDLDELEILVIQIQAGTQIDTATSDTQQLANSYSQAQAALSGMRIVKARAAGLQKKLAERLEQRTEEEGLLKQLEKRRSVLMVQEKAAQIAAQKALEEELRLAQLDVELEERTTRKRAELQSLRALSMEIREERRILSRLRDELEDERRKQQAAEGKARRLSDQRARLQALRSRASA